jgi:hypothetical protein
MQHAGVFRRLGLCSALGLAGFTVGCGQGAGQAGSGGKGAGAAIIEEQKTARKEARQARVAEAKAQRSAEVHGVKKGGAPGP